MVFLKVWNSFTRFSGNGGLLTYDEFLSQNGCVKNLLFIIKLSTNRKNFNTPAALGRKKTPAKPTKFHKN